MNIYTRKVQYYETDKMNFVHHSNYIRWFEESRVDYLEKLGLPFDALEAQGYFSPVLGLECRYHKACTFGDTVQITTALTEFGRVKFTFSYRIHQLATGVLLAEGTTTHCFVNAQGRAVSLLRCDAALAKQFCDICQKDASEFDLKES